LGVEEYELLVSTLNKLPILKEDLKSKKEELGLARRMVSSQRAEIDEVEKELETRDLDLERINSEIENIDQEVEELTLEITKEKEKMAPELEKLKKKQKGISFKQQNSNENILAIAFVLIAIYLASWSYQNDKEDYRDFLDEGFDCENGERVHGSLVLNGEDDCSNGHDEKDPFWSQSDAQSYDSDRSWEKIPGQLILGGLIFYPGCLFLLWGWVSEKMENRGSSMRYEIKKEKIEIKQKLESLENKKRYRVKKQSGFKRKKGRLIQLDKKLEEESKVLDDFEEAVSTYSMSIESLEREIEEGQNAIAPLIPYSDLLLGDG
jgi:DNA repair exonuclease SbcCD ATPase subunit|tara:strand:+ start:643 stop:1605 length:963 start_codon:yes stop_codon:yes gene_type:complete